MAERAVSRRTMFASLLGMSAAGTLASAQTPRRNNPEVISGGDLGFEVERTDRDGAKVGRFVVRSEGKWVEARLVTGLRKGIS